MLQFWILSKYKRWGFYHKMMTVLSFRQYFYKSYTESKKGKYGFDNEGLLYTFIHEASFSNNRSLCTIWFAEKTATVKCLRTFSFKWAIQRAIATAMTSNGFSLQDSLSVKKWSFKLCTTPTAVKERQKVNWKEKEFCHGWTECYMQPKVYGGIKLHLEYIEQCIA